MSNISGNRLKAARKAAGLNQRELGDRLGVDQAFISRIENGSSSGTPEFWSGAAKVLRVSIAYLMGETPISGFTTVGRKGILANYQAPRGLRELASDTRLAEALAITDEEWTTLASVPLPPYVRREGYMQLLITLRAICHDPCMVSAAKP